MDLKDLKKDYEKLQSKYKLPRFEELNENFEIEKIERNSDGLLRVIRKIMMEKIVNSLGFIEMLLNPMNAPRMYFSYIKAMNGEDRKSIENIYENLSKVSLFSLEREIDYNEKGEAELIKTISKTWQELKPDFRKILDNLKAPSNVLAKKGERSYFG
ncbi:hypothetical protein HYV50_00435 [Candidatus Pacearchaeota archaeon]|nr:hypothetical protein [Candidatus Pacearchaeota archaeon]